MLRIILFHGAYGSPNENWVPWLAKNAVAAGHEFIAPKMPTPEGQSLQNWLDAADRQIDTLKEGDILIGHSIGAAFALNFILQSSSSGYDVFLIAPFNELLGHKEFDEINKNFFLTDKDFETAKQKLSGGIVYASDNDPYVPFDLSKSLAEKLNLPTKQISGAGHFNAQSGYLQFLQLWDDIQNV
jgi:predicted alpha/beta hydrolase family esterase